MQVIGFGFEFGLLDQEGSFSRADFELKTAIGVFEPRSRVERWFSDGREVVVGESESVGIEGSAA